MVIISKTNGGIAKFWIGCAASNTPHVKSDSTKSPKCWDSEPICFWISGGHRAFYSIKVFETCVINEISSQVCKKQFLRNLVINVLFRRTFDVLIPEKKIWKFTHKWIFSRPRWIFPIKTLIFFVHFAWSGTFLCVWGHWFFSGLEGKIPVCEH